MATAKIDFAKGNGLVPVIVQDFQSRDVLMVAYMNEEAWEKTKETGKAHYYSRSRKGPWFKGEESGNFQEVKDAFIDCDSDTILLQVHQVGGTGVGRAHEQEHAGAGGAGVGDQRRDCVAPEQRVGGQRVDAEAGHAAERRRRRPGQRLAVGRGRHGDVAALVVELEAMRGWRIRRFAHAVTATLADL